MKTTYSLASTMALCISLTAMTGCGQRGWSLSTATPSEDLTIAAGATVMRRVTWNASQATSLRCSVSPSGSATSWQLAAGARIRLDADDEANGPTPEPPRAYVRSPSCEASFLFASDASSRFSPVDTDGRVGTGGLLTVSTSSMCSQGGALTFRITNDSTAAIAARWSASAAISEGDLEIDPPPADAFVKMMLVP